MSIRATRREETVVFRAHWILDNSRPLPTENRETEHVRDTEDISSCRFSSRRGCQLSRQPSARPASFCFIAQDVRDSYMMSTTVQVRHRGGHGWTFHNRLQPDPPTTYQNYLTDVEFDAWASAVRIEFSTIQDRCRWKIGKPNMFRILKTALSALDTSSRCGSRRDQSHETVDFRRVGAVDWVSDSRRPSCLFLLLRMFQIPARCDSVHYGTRSAHRWTWANSS